ncbi:MAG: hypothetical protein LQ343_004845 [Gyalolechia ehrenbergii]|nr:MAG: hypothetical protein LQ343_004845 [Gyalolechia ehrenbergii]
MAALIVGRVIAGAGGNGMYVGVLTLLSVNTSEKERPTYLGLIGLVYGIGTVIGPIVGGAFADSSATWRWGFYINLVVGAIFAPVYLFILPPFNPRPTESISSKVKDMDYLGAVLQAGAFVCGIMAINFGGTTYTWDSGQIIALFVVSGILFIIFGAQQTFNFWTSDNRMFPVHMLKMKEPVLLFIAMAACNAGSYVCMYYIPLYFQFIKGVDALDSGVRMLPFIIVGTLTILINGGVLSKTGFYMPWYVAGSTIVLIGGVLLSRVGLGTSAAKVYGYEILLGVGIGAYLQAGYAVIQGVLEPVHMAYGVTFILLGQLGGIALGLSISGAVFVNRALSRLQAVLPNVPHEQLESAVSGTSGGFFASLDPVQREQGLAVIMASLQEAFILVYVAGAVSLVASVFLSRKKLNLAAAAGGG